MSENPLIKKLGIKANHTLLVLNSPEGYIELLQPLPEGVVLDTQTNGSYDTILIFVKSKAEIDQIALQAIQVVKPEGRLWFCYPKLNSKIKTDIHRDVGWQVLGEAGWGPVTLVAIDNTWSALRFKPLDVIKYTPGSQRYNQKQSGNF